MTIPLTQKCSKETITTVISMSKNPKMQSHMPHGEYENNVWSGYRDSNGIQIRNCYKRLSRSHSNEAEEMVMLMHCEELKHLSNIH